MTDPSATNPTTADRLGWTVVSGNADAYLGHGFCAQANPKTPADETELPKRNKKDEPWRDFDPRDYRPYTTRGRWVRIPVDAKLTTDQMHRILERLRPVLRIHSGISVDLFFEDDTSNIMHPTAEGLAKTADENLKAIKQLEAKANFQTVP
ncbi:MAG: hypothetical protein JOZ02_00725 [Acidobacteria bacterium]|nr:hypothetical protein [Acidobacteriota bacterium]